MVKSSDATDIKRMEFDLAGKANADRGGVRETLDEENIIIMGRWLFGGSKTIDYSMEESRQAEYKLVFFVSFVFFLPLLHVCEKGKKKKRMASLRFPSESTRQTTDTGGFYGR